MSLGGPFSQWKIKHSTKLDRELSGRRVATHTHTHTHTEERDRQTDRQTDRQRQRQRDKDRGEICMDWRIDSYNYGI